MSATNVTQTSSALILSGVIFVVTVRPHWRTWLIPVHGLLFSSL
jgi:hypothetical protein